MTPSRSASLRETLAGYSTPSAPELLRQRDDGRIECLACGHRCRIGEGRPGVCRVRFVEGGQLLRPARYVAALACDPIEKKPFYHAFPGRDALTFGMLGCDLRCPYCQNWFTSQTLRDDEATAPPIPMTSKALADLAVREDAPVVASSYNEPLITADWAVEVFREAGARGRTCAFVSNGNATPEVLEYLRPTTELFKVDLKGFTEEAYREVGGRLATVLETIRRLKELDYWVEIVTLIVPNFNDSDDELKRMAAFLADVDPLMPWHVTAFHPDYKMRDRDRTTVDALLKAVDIGKATGLRYVYAGNAAGRVGPHENTYCHGCDAELIRRNGFRVTANRLTDGRCSECGTRIPGRWA